jgi:preprotein translocase subunit SecA
VFRTTDEKLTAITEEVSQLHATGRPVLIGTRSIDKSQQLSEKLTAAGVKHQVLNANEIEAEAEIVSTAGAVGNVTVATNMAGRGTDIKLAEGVATLGGLQVICTELHDAARIDRQLIGRCGRQGDPGTFRQYLAIDDDIIETGFSKKRAGRIKKTVAQGNGGEGLFGRLLRTAQRKTERQHFRDRNVLLYHEKERKKMQREMGQDPYLDTPD